MENVHLSVIPAKARILWLQVIRDPCLRRDDSEEAFFDTLSRLREYRVFSGSCTGYTKLIRVPQITT